MSKIQKEYPTGNAPSALPFYPELDDQAFEQFCTDLLNLHPLIVCLRHGHATTRRIVAATRLLSGTAQKGVDIRADAEQGEVWFFQCKHTKQFGPSEVSDAIALAERGFPQADQFVLVTTCGLGEEAQSKIYEREKWLWWDASRLTTEVLKLRPRENAINLVHRFFGSATSKALFLCSDQPLLTWQEFFAQDLSRERHHFHHRTKFVPWTNALTRLEAFAHSGAGQALVLSAAGGQGKSRLLLELAQRLEQQPQAPRVRFLNLNRHGLTGEQSNFLAREDEAMLLIVEDAHRLDAAIQDVARATAEAKSVRLLVATRPQALEAVKSLLYQSGYAERLEEPLGLPRWKQEDIHALAEQLLDPQRRLQVARLARLADRCPLLVVLGAALVNSGVWPETMTDDEDFRERVFRSFKEDFLRRQPESRRERLNRFINFLSFVSPAPKNETQLSKAAEVLGCSPLDVDEDLSALQAAGLVVENREGVRLYPDLFADAVLLDACIDHAGQPSFLHRTILQKLPISDFPALMRNVAQADWEVRARKGAKSALFDPIWPEFLRRFREGKWPDHRAKLTERILDQYAEGVMDQRHGRDEMLAQWASFAVYLPERTLELAELALETVKAPTPTSNEASEIQADVHRSVCASLPPLLKPIVIWHPGFAHRALDILWSLEADDPNGNLQNSSNAIAVIADAASFALQKPLSSSEKVMDWLEKTMEQPAAVERLRRQPWILSAVLKPFFGRAVDHNWSIGAVPVLEEAIRPVRRRFGSATSKSVDEAWRPDRLEVVKIIEKAVESHRDAPALLLQLGSILRHRGEQDLDPIVGEECRRALSHMLNTFELRVMRVLSSWAHHEISVEPGPNFNSELEAAEKRWSEFGRSVAQETIERFKTPHELCEFIRGQVRELATINSAVHADALLQPVAEVSPAWCTTLLDELLGTQDPTLDRFLWPVIHRARSHAPEAYRRAIASLPVGGRPEQLSGLINYFGWKQLHGDGLTQLERLSVMQAAKRTEETAVCALASVAGHYFSKEPKWAIEVLSQLKPSVERSGGAIVEALAQLAEKHAAALEPVRVAQCLANVGEFCFARAVSDEYHLDKVAKLFPKQVYEQMRSLYERAEADPAGRSRWNLAKTLPLGPISDAAYVDREIRALWEKAASAEAESFAQRFRLGLIRSLLWADAATAPDRLRALVAGCKNGAELKLLTKLAATQGSRFVFEFPDIVRSLLARGEELAAALEVGETLWLSAVGGGRSYTNHDLDPEYRYILEQSQALANRYRDDALLGKFYRTVAASEHHHIESSRRAFLDEADG